MQQCVADLHLHSKYSRAVSMNMTLPTMAQVGLQKGLDLLSACDWTHPLWFKEIRSQLEEHTEGMYKLKSQNAKGKSSVQNAKADKEILFLLSTEISSIYSFNGRVRRIHNLVFAPNFEIAEKINKELIKRGCNLGADGRPIIGLSSKNLLEMILSIDERVMLIPCHIWTPHFGIYGSASGFDSLEESFEELAPHIYGIETGLSSDPEMNWQIKELKNRSILSFSDAHSPAKMGREATVFLPKNGISNDKSQISNNSITYEDIRQAIMRKNPRWRIGYTIEFYPEEGKYHFSGHRNCKVVYGPEDIITKGNTCPVCKRRLTEGVLFRVQQLSNEDVKAEEKRNQYGLKWFTDKTHQHPPYVKLVPLLEIVAEGLESTVSSQKVKALFDQLCEECGSEIDILLKTPIEQVAKVAGPRIAEGVKKVREGNIVIDPGFDGEYGKVKIWNEEPVEEAEKSKEESQMSLI